MNAPSPLNWTEGVSRLRFDRLDLGHEPAVIVGQEGSHDAGHGVTESAGVQDGSCTKALLVVWLTLGNSRDVAKRKDACRHQCHATPRPGVRLEVGGERNRSGHPLESRPKAV